MTKKRLTLHGLLSETTGGHPAPPQRSATPTVTSGALRAMTESFQRMSDGAAEAEKLRSELEGSERVVELNTRLIAGSFVSDRLGNSDGLEIEDLAASILESGQQIPILVRPHPDDPDRYQIAYGHRRVAAARYLDVPVRAIVRTLSDAELVIAQGKENLDRRELSFIERAWFARGLEDRKFDRKTIMSALGVTKGDISVLISIARALPDELLKAIGPAPRIGRPRWLGLVEAWKNGSGDVVLVTSHPRFVRSSSDERFELVTSALSGKSPRPPFRVWAAPDGRPIVQISRTQRAGRLVVDERMAPAFTEFLAKRMPELFEAYQQQHKRS
jgi:ParB family transcriptional regulator, chromosome partitioning protein